MELKVLGELLRMTAATIHVFTVLTLFVGGFVFVIWITFYTRFWGIAVIYLIWIWVIDTHTPGKGGRKLNLIQGLKLYEYVRDYYPVKLSTVDGFKLDPKANYLFCCFPHGLAGVGATIAFATKWCGVNNLFPNHTFHLLTLDIMFKLPILREYFLSLGVCSVKAESINWLLSYPGGGKVACAFVGGAAEIMCANPGIYKVILKNRKGFIRLAMKNGSPVVPVFSFGEVDLYRQLGGSKGSVFERFRNWIKKKIRAAPVFISGRGYFQSYIGLVPFKRPLNVVVGKPIEIARNSNPTQEEVDALHQKFMTKLNELFEEHKHMYVENPEKTTLIIA